MGVTLLHSMIPIFVGKYFYHLFKHIKMTNSKSIFLVEDDKDDQISFTECIEEIENATMFGVASNGKEALDKLDNSIQLPDMIFMDINMPYINGLECLTAINNNSRLKNIPVVMLSTDTGQAKLSCSLGAKAFIKKPTDCKTLHAKVEQMINLDFIADSKIANQSFQYAY